MEYFGTFQWTTIYYLHINHSSLSNLYSSVPIMVKKAKVCKVNTHNQSLSLLLL